MFRIPMITARLRTIAATSPKAQPPVKQTDSVRRTPPQDSRKARDMLSMIGWVRYLKKVRWPVFM